MVIDYTKGDVHDYTKIKAEDPRAVQSSLNKESKRTEGRLAAEDKAAVERAKKIETDEKARIAAARNAPTPKAARPEEHDWTKLGKQQRADTEKAEAAADRAAEQASEAAPAAPAAVAPATPAPPQAEAVPATPATPQAQAGREGQEAAPDAPAVPPPAVPQQQAEAPAEEDQPVLDAEAFQGDKEKFWLLKSQWGVLEAQAGKILEAKTIEDAMEEALFSLLLLPVSSATALLDAWKTQNDKQKAGYQQKTEKNDTLALTTKGVSPAQLMAQTARDTLTGIQQKDPDFFAALPKTETGAIDVPKMKGAQKRQFKRMALKEDAFWKGTQGILGRQLTHAERQAAIGKVLMSNPLSLAAKDPEKPVGAMGLGDLVQALQERGVNFSGGPTPDQTRGAANANREANAFGEQARAQERNQQAVIQERLGERSAEGPAKPREQEQGR